MYQRIGPQIIVLALFFLLVIPIYHLNEVQAACPVPTVADPADTPAGKYPHQYELSEFEKLSGCKLSFSENPDIGKLNKELNGNKPLPAVAQRLPAEPLIYPPYEKIGKYGGRLKGVSKSPESGTSDVLSLRHVNFFRFHEDLKTIVPCVATGFKYNDDFTQLTIYLRKDHKWSDGAPFTAEDIDFWYNDIKMNKDYYSNVESQWIFGGKPMQVEAIDKTTVKFTFAAPAPNFLTYLAISYRQPFQPKHVLSRVHPKYNSDADKEARALGFKSWVERFRLYFHDWKDSYHSLSGPEGSRLDIPTLESHVLVKETPEFRRFVANPYFFMVDTAGNQLPYINEHYESYSEDMEVTILKMMNGEIDYKQQALELEKFPALKQKEASGPYRVLLKPAIGKDVIYCFNITHENPELRKIYGDVRFRQAMSLAMNRSEIREIVYLGQGITNKQALPIDPATFDFVDPKYVTQFTEYDPDAANALLDKMGLTKRDSDGFRLRFDGKPFVLRLQYAPQFGPTQTHQLVKKYWDNVGVRTDLKEITSDLYRQQTGANKHDISTMTRQYNSRPKLAGDIVLMMPPFGSPINKLTGNLWDDWVQSNGTKGIEPPADIKRLYDLAIEFKSYPFDSAESNRIGSEVIKIHGENLITIGVVGDTPTPVYVNNRIGNFGGFAQAGYPYYWAYPFRIHQWFIK